MTRPSGSVAREAFADARAVVAAHRLPSARQRPAIDFVGAAGRAESHPWPQSVGPVPLAVGPVHAALAELRAGAITARQLVESSLAAIEVRSGELGAVVALCTDALGHADRLDDEFARGAPVGPLHGIPITVKDVIDVAGVPTRAGSDAYLDVPAHDATSVARLKAAGAVIVGKASTHEFALGVTAPLSHNPVDPERLAGGSSGGSAVAVATGMGLASLGTDTRASIRVPASLSGVVGLKPTYGLVPTDGVVTLSWTMDHVAPMAASVADAALLLEVLAPECGPLRTTLGSHDWAVAGLRIGVPPAAFADADRGVVHEVEALLAILASDGAELVTVDRPSEADLDLANAAGLLVSRSEAATFHRSLGLDRTRYWQEVAEQLEEAEQVTAVEYLDAQRARLDLRDRLMAVFADADVLMMPTTPVTAPLRSDFAAHLMTLARNAIPWSLVGFPAISLRCGTADGLPVGLQVVAPPYRENLLVAVAAACEHALLPPGA